MNENSLILSKDELNTKRKITHTPSVIQADTLFTFMTELRYLLSILENRMISPRYNDETINYLRIPKIKKIAFPMKCFVISLYQKYSRKDVCRILNWEQDESSTIYGYKIKYNTCPIFVTYEKKDNIASSTKYEDEFINNQVFSWMTRSRVSADSIESRKLIASSDSGLKILLFVKKSDGEGTDFYYMGRVHPIAWEQKEIYNE